MRYLILPLLAALLCAGCMEYTQEIVVNPDGSGNSTVDFAMSSSLLAMAQQAEGDEPGAEQRDPLAETREKFSAMRDRLAAHPAVRRADYREYMAGDMQHFAVSIELSEIARLGDLQEFLNEGGIGSGPDEGSNRSQLSLTAQENGLRFRYLMELVPDGAENGGGENAEMGRAMLASAFAGKYFTVRVRGPQVRVPASALANSSAPPSGDLVEWRIPMTELLGGKFSRELLADISVPALDRAVPAAPAVAAAPRPAAAPGVPVWYTGTVIPTLPRQGDNYRMVLLPWYQAAPSPYAVPASPRYRLSLVRALAESYALQLTTAERSYLVHLLGY